MFLFVRSIAAVVAFGLIASVMTEPSTAAGLPVSPVMNVPSAGTPLFMVSVGVQLASIPTKYPRFRVNCEVWSRPGQGTVFSPNPEPQKMAAGTQDWSLTNGGYSGTLTVRVFALHGWEGSAEYAGQYNCMLFLLDNYNNPFLPDPNAFDPSLRPQQGTTFMGQVGGNVPKP